MENLTLEQAFFICTASLGLLPLLLPSGRTKDLKKSLPVLLQTGLCISAGIISCLTAPVLSVPALGLLPPIFLFMLSVWTFKHHAFDQQRMQRLSALSICTLLFCILNETLHLFLPWFWAVCLAEAASGFLMLPTAKETVFDLQRFVPSGTAFLETLCIFLLTSFFPMILPVMERENTETAIIWTAAAGLLLVLLLGSALFYRMRSQLRQTLRKSQAILDLSQSCFAQNADLLARQHDAIQTVAELEKTQTAWQINQKALFVKLQNLLSESRLSFDNPATIIANTAARYRKTHPDLCIGIQIEPADLDLEEDLMISQILDCFLQNHLQFFPNESFVFQVKGDEQQISILCTCLRKAAWLEQNIILLIQDYPNDWQILQELSLIRYKRNRFAPAGNKTSFQRQQH